MKNPPLASTLSQIRGHLDHAGTLRLASRHCHERAIAARWLRDIRSICRHNGFTPREVMRLARDPRVTPPPRIDS